MANADIALGLMCKAPVEGGCKTRLCPPLTAREAAELSRCFIADVAAVIDGVCRDGGGDGGIGVAVYAPAGGEAAFDGLLPPHVRMLAQRGADLGTRLLHATEDLLAAGHAGVCLLNADSPTLPAALLRRAIAALRAPGDRVVLGPASDGGYCLIALKHPHVALFRGVTWSTGHVLAETLVRAAGLALPVSLLPIWYDVDDLGSLQLLVHELFGGGNPLLAEGLASSPAPRTRRYLRTLLRGADAARFGLPELIAPG